MKRRIMAILFSVAIITGFVQISGLLAYAADTKTTEDINLEEAQAKVLADEKENSFRFKDGEYIEPEKADNSGISTLTSSLYSIDGIDVSKWQGNIDWSKVKEEADFAVLRCSNSTITLDPYWKKNADACTANNIPFGVYIYSKALKPEQAKKEAEYVLSLVKDYKIDYPIFFDIEDKAVTDYNLTKADILALCTIFCETIENAGYQAGVYSSKSWWTTYLTSDTYNNWVRWVARYNSTISESGYTKPHQFWQYTETGKISGISGYVDRNYAVSYLDISKLTTDLSETSYDYDGTAKKPLVTITGLSKGIDYTLSYENNTEIGNASVTITGIGSYKGTKTINYTIKDPNAIDDNIDSEPEEDAVTDISKLTAKLSYTSYLFTGTQRKPSVTIDGLIKNTDYTVSYQANVYPGTASVTITGIGKYKGTLTKTFTIILNKVKGISTTVTNSSVNLSWTKQESVTGYKIYRYDDSTEKWKLIKTISSASTNSYTNTGLISGTLYQYRLRSYYTRSLDNKNFYGTYSDAYTVQTTAVPSAVENLKLSTTTTTSITLKWTKMSGVTGYKVYRYNTSTKSWKLIKTIKSASTVTYTNTGLTTGSDYSYRVKAYNEAGDGNYSAVLNTVTRPQTVTISSLSSTTTKKVKINWKKLSCDGYVIEYATNSKFSSATKLWITSGNNSSWTVKNLKSGSKYYLRIRAYSRVNGIRYYGNCSIVKNIKCK